MTDSELKDKSPWLHAWYDPLAGLKTMSTCVRLGDLHADGDSKLCVAETDKKLRVYKGTSMIAEHALLDNPVAMILFYPDLTLPRTPTIAVAAGSHVFVYRQLRPYKKWSCPPMEISDVEVQVWNDFENNDVDIDRAIATLSEARDNGIKLTHRSTELLLLESSGDRDDFILAWRGQKYVQNTLITCMDLIKKDSDDQDAVSYIIVGTEAGEFYVLPQDLNNSNFICKVTLPSVPVLLSVWGLFDVEWRVSITCRDGKLYSVRGGDVRRTAILSGTITDIGSQPVALTSNEKFIYVATMDKTVSCFSLKGKRISMLLLPADITDICGMQMKRSKTSFLLLVGLTTGEIRVYKESTLVNRFMVDRPVTALRFGNYGREENCLAIVHAKGSLTVKIWRRTADIESVNLSAGPPPEQEIPLQVPKKTRLYVEQTQRERDMAPQIHRAFQKDLCKLRLETARAYVKTLTDGQMGASPLGSADVRVHAHVQGLGPLFLLRVLLQNAGTQPIFQAKLMVSFDPEVYVMGHVEGSQQLLHIPLLLPGPKYNMEVQVQNIDPQGRAGQLLLLLFSGESTSAIPILSATVRMPTSELLTV